MVNAGFLMLSSAGCESLHMRDLACHQELQCNLGAGIVTKIYEALVDNLRPGFGRNVAAQIYVKFARNLEVVRGPGVALRVEQIDAAAARYSDERIGLRGFRSNFMGLR